VEKLFMDNLRRQFGYNTRTDDLDATLSLSQGPANPDDLSEMFGKRKWELIVLGTLDFVPRPRIFLMAIEYHADSAARVGVMVVYRRALELFGQYTCGATESSSDVRYTDNISTPQNLQS
jgi:hypothetical protein